MYPERILHDVMSLRELNVGMLLRAAELST